MVEPSETPHPDPGLRRMLKWVLIAFVVVVVVAVLVVEFTMRWFGGDAGVP